VFDKILIANRGEIACRVIRTARALGVKTVAVYSDADAGALHVALADEAVRLGSAPVAESYLRGDLIVQAAVETGAQAVHPGYGFLSENPDFVEAVAAAGLVFIGPSADAIRKMGLKDAAKVLMASAGVPVVPGYHGADQDPDVLARAADEIGYPVLIKAVAGGGGKGMRLVEGAANFRENLAAAQSEALTSFGNATVLIEKYIQAPRHIEVQVFGDGRDAVHLFERDCSLQRRHQKVLPASLMRSRRLHRSRPQKWPLRCSWPRGCRTRQHRCVALRCGSLCCKASSFKRATRTIWCAMPVPGQMKSHCSGAHTIAR